jgi:glutamine amidotransferase
VHNGAIRDFQLLRRRLTLELEDTWFAEITGSTDSELMFLLALQFGISDDQRLYAVRYSSEQDSRTLFYSREVRALERELGPCPPAIMQQMTGDAHCVVSEPLSDLMELWEPIPEATFITIDRGRVETRPFEPAT